MREVTIRIRFNRECLGSARRRGAKGQVKFCMLRDPRHRVMFLPSWWHQLLRYAATVTNQQQGIVKRIDWNPVIDGMPRAAWKRTIVADGKVERRMRYAVHEAFLPGDVVGINAVLPDGLSIEQFQELLEIVGTYKGISPFQRDDERYGTFEVLSVRPTVRRMPVQVDENKAESEGDSPSGS